MIASKLSNNDKLPVVISLLKENIDNGHVFKGTIDSDSMAPLLKIGDLIHIGSISQEKLRLGDLIVYKTFKHLCCHRYMYARIYKNERIIVTKADSRPHFDSDIILQAHVVGKVLLIEKPQSIIKLTSPCWKTAGYLIGAVSFIQGTVITTLCLIKRRFTNKQDFSIFKKALAFPFSKAIAFILALSLRKAS